MESRRWFGRWMIWVVLLLRGSQDCGEYATVKYALAFAYGVTSLVAAVLLPFVFGTDLLTRLSLSLGGIVLYLLIGLGVFFSERTTNMDIPWQRNGPW